MCILTLSFKGILLETIDLLPGKTGIGRDPSNDVHIDSLAVADFHAVIRATPEGCVIRQLQAGFPIFLNDKPIAENVLHQGDHIRIGKHSLHFSGEQPFNEFPDHEGRSPVSYFRPFEGSFQVMNGKRIGMVIPLKTSVTQIGKEVSGRVIVTRGNDAFTISAGSADVLLTINGQIVKEEEAALADGDIVRINASLLQFFRK